MRGVARTRSQRQVYRRGPVRPGTGDQRDAGAAVKAATIIFAELTLAVAIVFIVLLLVRVYG